MIKRVILSAGEKVNVIDKNELKIGILVNMFAELEEPIAIVKFDDGEIAKVPVTQISKVQETKIENDQEPEENNRKPFEDEVDSPDFKDEITISHDEFVKRASKAMAKLATDTVLLGAVMCAELDKEFFLKGEND